MAIKSDIQRTTPNCYFYAFEDFDPKSNKTDSNNNAYLFRTKAAQDLLHFLQPLLILLPILRATTQARPISCISHLQVAYAAIA